MSIHVDQDLLDCIFAVTMSALIGITFLWGINQNNQ